MSVCRSTHLMRESPLESKILDALNAHINGLLTITDKSSPEEIQHAFNVSKGSYKKAIGALYKQKKNTTQSRIYQANLGTQMRATV